MTNAVIDDITGKVIPRDRAYKVQIRNMGLGINKDIDVSYAAVQDLLAATTDIPWYKLHKDAKTGKWVKIPHEDIPDQA